MDSQEKKYAPVLPYDVTIKDDFHYYDNPEYVNDRDRTSPILSKKESGNLVKFYSCNVDEGKTIINSEHEEKK